MAKHYQNANKYSESRLEILPDDLYQSFNEIEAYIASQKRRLAMLSQC